MQINSRVPDGTRLLIYSEYVLGGRAMWSVKRIQFRRWSLAGVLILVLAGVLFAALTAPAPGVRASAPSAGLQTADLPYVPGEILIGWEPDADSLALARPGTDWNEEDRSSPAWQQTARSIAARTGRAVLDAQPTYGTARLAVAPGQELAEVARLAALPWIKYAEPNYLAHAAASYPNDYFFGDQWYLRRIKAPEAWDVITGSYSIVVAVLDSGVDRFHPEFAGRLLPGYDYVNGDNDPDDDFGHGTHVTGLLAAAANNKTGIAGLAQLVKVLPFKVLDATGAGSYENIALAIRRAADSNAQVINLSLGGIYDSLTLREAVAYAAARNVLIVAAAGNCAQAVRECNSLVNPDFFPAAYPGVLAVAASDHYDNWAGYSGYKAYVALAAPGGTTGDPLWSTWLNGYGYEFGTSMAAPQVSGAAVLAFALSPTLSAVQVAEALKATAEQTGFDPITGQPLSYAGGRNDYFGAGRLNVERLVRWLMPSTVTAEKTFQRFALGNGEQQPVQILLTNPSLQPVTWQASVTEGAAWLSVYPPNGQVRYGAPALLTLRASPIGLAPGDYDGVVRIQGGPTGGFNFYALLRLTSTLRHTYTPWLALRRQAVDWIDPIAGGRPLYLGDNEMRQEALPFSFTFYGRPYTSLWVGENGLVAFDWPMTSAVNMNNGSLPSASQPNNAIYAFWADWKPGLGGQVYVQQPDPNRYVITWYQVRQTPSAPPQTFQIVLSREGRVLLQYASLQSALQRVIGMENYDGTFAHPFACPLGGNCIASGDVISLTPVLPW